MEIQFWVRRPGAEVLVTLQVYQEHDQMVCGLRFIEGNITLRPRALRAAIIEELQKIEQAARESGCTEMRHAGDDRSWCLPGYEPMPELRNGRRKRL